MSKNFLLIAFLSLFFFALSVDAKVLPRFTGTAKGGGVYSSSFVVSPKLRGDRRAVIIYFGGLSKVANVSYVLTYQGNGMDQGAVGSVDSSEGSTASRELLFGTCSTSVCTYQSNISNAKLEVTVAQLSGKKTLKKYRIKV
ncbi:MAG: hypothetical protein V1922_04350 [bacterium]